MDDSTILQLLNERVNALSNDIFKCIFHVHNVTTAQFNFSTVPAGGGIS